MDPQWPSWKKALSEEFKKPYFHTLTAFVAEEYKAQTVFPPAKDMFNALKATPYEATNVVILGQDPYHHAGQAHGLSFSVQHGVKPPPSLVNIFKELHADLGYKPPKDGCLLPWAEQGVLLLNSVLTVRAHAPGSHKGKGWEPFTDAILQALNAKATPVVFVLWGKYARDKASLIDSVRHTVIESAHPSPMSANDGFFGSRPFSKVNEALVRYGQPPINWKL